MHSLSAADDTSVVKFRGANYDAAVEAARQALGPRVKVVAADRVRRGGIGGFFATDLGVEVSVALHDETVDQALERLVAATAEEDRTRWLDQVTSMQPAIAPTPAPAPAPLEPAVEVSPAPLDPAVEVSVVVPTLVGGAPKPHTANLQPAQPPEATAPRPVARRRTLLPTRGHVDLAISAAAELTRLTGEHLPGRRIAVHVVVTSDDGRSVEADAVVEADAFLGGHQ
ncbi:MAG: hypothetical protein ACRDZZ_09115 [Ilumatobacteraceae bacterium]